MITVIEGQNELNVKMTALTATLNVDATPRDVGYGNAGVYINGQSAGRVPLTIELTPGAYCIQALMPQPPAWGTRFSIITPVTLAPGETKDIMLAVDKTGGAFSISSNPGGAAVYLNGIFIGYTSAVVGVLAGGYAIKFTKPGYEDVTINTSVESGSSRTISTNLIPLRPPLQTTSITYSGAYLGYRSCPVATAWMEPVFSINIKNTATQPQTRKFTFAVWSQDIITGAWGNFFTEEFTLSIPAGETLFWQFNNALPGPGGYVKYLFGRQTRIYADIRDDLGGGINPLNVAYS